MKKSDKVRKSYENLEPQATNEEIKLECNEKYRFEPSSQLVYSVCGTETERLLVKFNGKQLKTISDICRSSFNNNYKDLKLAASAASRLSNA